MKFQVQVTHQAQKDLRHLPTDRRYALLQDLKRLAEDPTPDGDAIKAIAGDPTGILRRLRVGEYRVFFEVEKNVVFVLRCVQRQALDKAIRQLLGR